MKNLLLLLALVPSLVHAAQCRPSPLRRDRQPDFGEYVCEGAKVYICPNNVEVANECRLVTIESVEIGRSGLFQKPSMETTYVMRDEKGQRATYVNDGSIRGDKWTFFAAFGCQVDTNSDARFCVGDHITTAETVQEGDELRSGTLVGLELGLGGRYGSFGVLKHPDGSLQQIWAQGMYAGKSRQEMEAADRADNAKKVRDPWLDQVNK